MGLFGKSSGAPTVGVNIGASLIKIVEAKTGKQGPQVTALGIAPTPPGTIQNEVIVDPQALGQAIRDLLSESGIATKRCVSSVSGQSSVVVRIIEVPKMTSQELKETMKWEVERHVPFAATEVIMDFQAIEKPAADGVDDQNMEVLLAVAQQEFITSHVETLFAAGLEPSAIDVEPLAISRSLLDAAGEEDKEGTVAIVNIGSSATELGVYQNRTLAFPRTLPIAGDAITRAISERLGLSIAQAERLKREKSAVLLDRIAAPPPMQFTDEDQGYDDTPSFDPTLGFDAAPAEDDASESDLGFIPGLGFGFSTPEAEEPAQDAGQQSAEEDAASGVPFMDFDLTSDDEDLALTPVAPPKLDLSGPMEESDGIGSDAALAVADAETEIDTSQFTEEMIFDAMESTLTDLVSEIRRSIEYYSSRFQSQPDKIYLCGGSSKIRDLDKLVEADLGIPVFLANGMQNVSVFSKSLSEDYLEEIAAIFPVGVGLAIRDMLGE